MAFSQKYPPVVYKRRLPHIQPVGGTFFITMRLANSLPAYLVNELTADHQIQLRRIHKEFEEKSKKEPEKDWQKMKNLALSAAKEDYHWLFDHHLDIGTYGPMWLEQREIADLVVESIHFLQNKGIYDLFAYCIMRNHVHLVIGNTTQVLHQTLKSLKQFTGYRGNKILGRSGNFWQKESYDHWVRNDNALQRVINFSYYNPDKANLISNGEEWKYRFKITR